MISRSIRGDQVQVTGPDGLGVVYRLAHEHTTDVLHQILRVWRENWELGDSLPDFLTHEDLALMVQAGWLQLEELDHQRAAVEGVITNQRRARVLHKLNSIAKRQTQ